MPRGRGLTDNGCCRHSRGLIEACFKLKTGVGSARPVGASSSCSECTHTHTCCMGGTCSTMGTQQAYSSRCLTPQLHEQDSPSHCPSGNPTPGRGCPACVWGVVADPERVGGGRSWHPLHLGPHGGGAAVGGHRHPGGQPHGRGQGVWGAMTLWAAGASRARTKHPQDLYRCPLYLYAHLVAWACPIRLSLPAVLQ